MKRLLTVLLVAIAFLAAVPAAYAVVAEVRYSLPTTNTDNSAITTAEQATIVATAFIGDSAAGPWTTIGTSAPGATTITSGNLTLTRGSTYWFTAEVTLHGRMSAKAVAMSAVYDYATPNAPSMILIILK